MLIQNLIPLGSKTTMRIGGKARYYADILTRKDVEEAWRFASAATTPGSSLPSASLPGIPLIVLGGGSNTVFADGVVNALVVRLKNDGMTVDGNIINVGAGKILASLINDLAKHSLDLSTLTGIPGTIGGAVIMNAGCHGATISDVVEEVCTLMPNGEMRTRHSAECAFGVRHSVFQHESELILSARLALAPGAVRTIRERMQRHITERRARQPLQYANCGSVFRNPPKDVAWKLIAEAGLRGLWCGGAQVSEKHTNFIVNRNGATAADIVALVDIVQREVLRTSGISLEPELVVVAVTGSRHRSRKTDKIQPLPRAGV